MINPLLTEEGGQQLLTELGIENLGSEQQDQILEKVSANLMKRVTALILERLPEAELDQFEALTTGDDRDALYTFLTTQIPDYDTAVDTVIQEELAINKEIVKKAVGGA